MWQNPCLEKVCLTCACLSLAHVLPEITQKKRFLTHTASQHKGVIEITWAFLSGSCPSLYTQSVIWWSWKEPDLLVDEFPWCSKWNLITGFGGFLADLRGRMFWTEQWQLRQQLKSLLRLASFLSRKHSSSSLTLLILLLPSPCSPSPSPLSEAADNLKRKEEGTWIKTEGTSLRYVSWCSSDL